MNAKEVNIKAVNNGFVVCFDTPSHMPPLVINKMVGVLPPEFDQAIREAVQNLTERAGLHDHEHLVFTDLLSLVNWLNKYFSKEAV